MVQPLFILSFRHRDELNKLAERGGWQAIAARRAENAEARFAGSGAGIAVVDARGALDEGLEAVRMLADAAEAADDAEAIRDLIASAADDTPCEPRLEMIVTTHRHWDHVRALPALASLTGARTTGACPLRPATGHPRHLRRGTQPRRHGDEGGALLPTRCRR